MVGIWESIAIFSFRKTYISYMDCHLSQFIPHLFLVFQHGLIGLITLRGFGQTSLHAPEMNAVWTHQTHQARAQIVQHPARGEWAERRSIKNDWLVVSTPLKNMKVNGKDYPWLSHNMTENKKCVKPPTRWAWSWHPSDPSEFGDSAYDTPVAKFLAGVWVFYQVM